MKKFIFGVFSLIFIPCSIYAQEGTGYYKTDTETVVGVTIPDLGNKKNCQFFYVILAFDSVKFFPNQVREYGFDHERVYVSQILNIDNQVKPVFVEKLTHGKKSLYYYKGKTELFLIEKDSLFFEPVLKKGEDKKNIYKRRLKEIAYDCPSAVDAANFTRYNKKSMIRFTDWYEKCETRPFPHFRFGVRAGYEWFKILDPPQSIELFNVRYQATPSVGLFLDAPIFMSNFSFNLGFNYSHHGYSYNNLLSEVDYDFVANSSSLTLPILLRYSFPTNKYRFFMQPGGIFEYNFNQNAYVYESAIQGKIINLTRTIPFDFDEFRLGFSLGAGFEYRVTRRNYAFLEFSLNQMFGSNISNRNFLLTLGLNI